MNAAQNKNHEPVILLPACVGATRLRSAVLSDQEIMTHVISLHFSSSQFTSSSRYTGILGEIGVVFSELQ